MLLKKSLIHHWRMHLAVAAGAAVACAILTGALVVGSSIRVSLRAIAEERLGAFQSAIQSPRLFNAGLAAKLARSPSYPGSSLAEPAALLGLNAAAIRETEDGQRLRASRVLVAGVDADFFRKGFPGSGVLPPSPAPPVPPGGAVLNDSLARELRAAAGDFVVFNLERWSAAPLESFIGNRAETGRGWRVQVAAVIEDRGPGLFSLQPSQSAPLLAYVQREELAAAIGAPGKAAALLAPARGGRDAIPPPPGPLPPGNAGGGAPLAQLDRATREALQLEDAGYRLRIADGAPDLFLESERMILEEDVVRLSLEAARRLRFLTNRALVHLAESISLAGGEPGKAIPYSTIAAMDSIGETSLQPGDLWLNEWAARDLGLDPLDPGAAAGKTVEVVYFAPRPDETVSTAKAAFRLRGILPLAGTAADPRLTPEFPGITDQGVKRMSDWDPPFPMNLSRIRKQDEEYWEQHRAAPKAFVSWEDGQKLFAGKFGPATSIIIAPPGGEAPARSAERFAAELIGDAGFLAAAGLDWKPIRADSLAAASGSTDFGMLFVSFSFFLIFSAAIQVALLFKLGLERRSRETGTLLALGFSARALRRYYLREAALVAALGGAAGLGLAAGYAGLLLHGLETWWRGASRASFLVLDLEPADLAAGYGMTLAIVLAAVYLTLRRLGRFSVRGLLAGKWIGDAAGAGAAGRLPKKSAAAAISAGFLALVLIAAAMLGGNDSPAAAFFGAGALLLIAAAALFSVWLHLPMASSARLARLSAWRLGGRNAARAPGRSLMTHALVASATFILVAVQANRHDPAGEAAVKASGSGGYSLYATTEVPLALRFDAPAGRSELGIEKLRIPLPGGGSKAVPWNAFKAFGLRVRPGDDTSCLNLYAPREPRILGAGRDFIERGGFVFKETLPLLPEEEGNPWKLLNRSFPGGEVPAFGDANSVQWILHKKVGDVLAVRDDRGAEMRLKLAGTLSGSLFQGELLIGEGAFAEHFPRREGFQFFLLDFERPMDAEAISEVEQGLEAGLETYGLDAGTTGSLLARYQAVENTYLSTFGALGGLGLLFGTLGLAVVLVRNTLERRGELALLAALGFRRRRIAAVILAENVFILASGMLSGAAAALLAALPRLLEPGSDIPWGSMAGLLSLVLLAGILAGALAARFCLRAPLIPALRAE